jgi:hypothetical protein
MAPHELAGCPFAAPSLRRAGSAEVSEGWVRCSRCASSAPRGLFDSNGIDVHDDSVVTPAQRAAEDLCAQPQPRRPIQRPRPRRGKSFLPAGPPLDTRPVVSASICATRHTVSRAPAPIAPLPRAPALPGCQPTPVARPANELELRVIPAYPDGHGQQLRPAQQRPSGRSFKAPVSGIATAAIDDRYRAEGPEPESDARPAAARGRRFALPVVRNRQTRPHAGSAWVRAGLGAAGSGGAAGSEVAVASAT